MIITAYFCAPVRGRNGDDVLPEVKRANENIGIALGQTVALAFSELDLFIPHEHEVVIDALWRRGLATNAILDACCDIIEERQVLIAYIGNGISGGMAREIKHAENKGIPVIKFVEWDNSAKECICRTIASIHSAASAETPRLST